MSPVTAIGAEELRAAMVAYRDALRAHQQVINRLNVYPVPDGDTGTNMMLTLEAVVRELGELEGPPAMSEVSRAMAHGSLMGARGNSGIILAQLLRGIGERLGVVERAGPAAVVDAFVTASELARTAPRRAARARAGGGDAAGAGYLLLFDALLNVLDGRPLPTPGTPGAAASTSAAPSSPSSLGAGVVTGAGCAASPARRRGSPEAAGFAPDELRYEVMYLLDAPDETIPALKEVWEGIGDSIVVVGGEGLWNCHIHTNDIGAAIEAAIDIGHPHQIRVTDLAEQVEEERWVRDAAAGSAGAGPGGGWAVPAPVTGVVAVVAGEGIGRIFRSLGVQRLVPGGQSMNPSTAQLLEAVDSLGSAEVVLLPNNENIEPVAKQVDALSAKTVRVVPTGSIVEGFAALLAYDPAAGVEENVAAMTASARRVLPAAVTRAVRDADTEVGPVREGEWIGMSRRGVVSVGSGPAEAALRLLDGLLEGDHELVTVIEGEGSSAADTRRITEWLHEEHPGVAAEVHHGGQPLYPYLFGIE
jgi:dihydroxyacetone kinase-like predicted kinase